MSEAILMNIFTVWMNIFFTVLQPYYYTRFLYNVIILQTGLLANIMDQFWILRIYKLCYKLCKIHIVSAEFTESGYNYKIFLPNPS